jgi:nucleotide-binding universal stress UspA family protein
MFEKVLIGTDFSPASDCLIRCIAELKALGLEQAVLAHVIYVANTPGLEERLAVEAAPHLERQKALLEEQGLKVIVEAPVGLPAHTLADLAERHDVSLVLIGSHGKGMLRAAALGSVSARLLHLTPRPVLLARIALLEGEKCHLVCSRLFAHILFATDFSETAEQALDYVGLIARETGCPVTLLHVLDTKGGKTLLAEKDARLLLEAKKARLERKGAGRVAAELCAGDPAEVLVRKSREGGFSLVAMGSQGKGIVRELILGSVANEAARTAGLPVLLIPAKRHSQGA